MVLLSTSIGSNEQGINFREKKLAWKIKDIKGWKSWVDLVQEAEFKGQDLEDSK